MLGAVPALAEPLRLPEHPEERAYWLGETLSHYEGLAAKAVGGAKACLRAEAERWQRDVLAACADEACRDAAHVRRLAILHGLQPGAWRIRGWEPDPGPALVAILAPEHLESGAARDFKTPPEFEAEGRLVMAHGDPHHMGLALRSDTGQAHVLVFDMELGNQPAHKTLQSLIQADPDARYRVRGGSEPAPDTVANFNPSQCRFVYRLPKP